MTRYVTWDVWIAISDKRTCARCAALHGTLYRRGEGPVPPLHPNCRCDRRLSHIEIIDDTPPTPPQPTPTPRRRIYPIPPIWGPIIRVDDDEEEDEEDDE